VNDIKRLLTAAKYAAILGASLATGLAIESGIERSAGHPAPATTVASNSASAGAEQHSSWVQPALDALR
jgi:hypothetical protein